MKHNAFWPAAEYWTPEGIAWHLSAIKQWVDRARG